MQPLEQLLDRVRWDPAFGTGTFALGYADRVLRCEVIVPLAAVTVSGEGRRRVLAFEDEHGIARTIPLHRVRVVYRDGVAIWRRPAPETKSRP